MPKNMSQHPNMMKAYSPEAVKGMEGKQKAKNEQNLDLYQVVENQNALHKARSHHGDMGAGGKGFN